MKKSVFFFLVLLFSFNLLSSQDHFEFSAVDTDGNTQDLYADYLNQGTTVVIKLFFVACPPCNAIAKDVQTLYEDWGEGQYDVQFMEVTTQSGDDDNDVKGYKAKHGITFPSISIEGGAKSISDKYKSGFFGTYWGTPSFAVVSPDGSVDYGSGSNLQDIHDAIAATGATGMENTVTETNYNINISWTKDQPGNLDALSLQVQSASNPAISYSVASSTNLVQFAYPSSNILEIQDPILVINYSDNQDVTKNVTASDITVLRKHILGFNEFTEQEKFIAADVNGDDKVSSIDIITLRKVILGFDNAFPNGVASYVPLMNNIPINTDAGSTINIDIQMIKKGDLN